MIMRLVITFLPRGQDLLISCLHSPSAVILEPQNIKSDTVSTVSPSISHEDLDSIPGLGRSSGEGKGNPLQYLAWRIPQTEEPGGI